MIKFPFIIGLMTAAFLVAWSEPGQSGELTIIYTANSNGKLTACNCPNDPYGGLSERVTLIRDLRKKEQPFLLVDSGNMVSLFGDHELKAECVARIMNLMKYDAAGVGRSEMYHGITSARAMSRTAKFPMISTTIVYKNDLKPVFQPHITKKINGVSVTILALGDSTFFLQEIERDYDYKILPVKNMYESIASAIATQSDFIVVLSQMALESNTSLLRHFPEIDLIVEGYGNKKYDPPITTPEGVIVSPGAGGEHVGLITLEKSDGNITVKRSELIPVLDIPEDNQAHSIVRYYYNHIK
ncbi:MAG TPA: hypothetical protein VMZ04_00300 [Anaerolineae bacterium]|nr:hypothetical protein [Anaerolineae bacterium]